jgi:MOSC domain-containing protein YiiM
MTGTVLAVYVAAAAEAPMQSLTQARLEAGRGIRGDRYYVGTGTFSDRTKNRTDQEITLIESEQIDEFNRSNGLRLDYGAARRNVVTSGVRLNELIGVHFSVGEAMLEGLCLCEPCGHLAALVSAIVLPGLVRRAGIRARIVSGGTIKPSDPVVIHRVHVSNV